MREHWCILRTSGRKTIPLAESLKGAGLDVWTPRKTRKQRLPRSRATETRTFPIMPTFVFARAKHIPDLHDMARSSAHPQFSIQIYRDRYPLIADADLRPLRDVERKTIPLESIKPFGVGDQVKITDGGFAGLTGIIESSDGRHTLVCFPGSKLSIKISTLLLRQEYAMNDEIAA